MEVAAPGWRGGGSRAPRRCSAIASAEVSSVGTTTSVRSAIGTPSFSSSAGSRLARKPRVTTWLTSATPGRSRAPRRARRGRQARARPTAVRQRPTSGQARIARSDDSAGADVAADAQRPVEAARPGAKRRAKPDRRFEARRGRRRSGSSRDRQDGRLPGRPAQAWRRTRRASAARAIVELACGRIRAPAPRSRCGRGCGSENPSRRSGRRSTSRSSTRLNRSTSSDQSTSEISRMLVMMLRTVTLPATCRWCSACTTPSAVRPWRARRWSIQVSAGAMLGSWSRRRWTSWTKKASESARGSSPASTAAGGSAARPPAPSRRSAIASACASAGAAGHDPRCDAPQVLDQHDAQRDGDGPQLADGERLDLLVGPHVASQRFGIEQAVGVGDERPGEAEARAAGPENGPAASFGSCR